MIRIQFNHACVDDVYYVQASSKRITFKNLAGSVSRKRWLCRLPDEWRRHGGAGVQQLPKPRNVILPQDVPRNQVDQLMTNHCELAIAVRKGKKEAM